VKRGGDWPSKRDVCKWEGDMKKKGGGQLTREGARRRKKEKVSLPRQFGHEEDLRKTSGIGKAPSLKLGEGKGKVGAWFPH